MVYGVFKNYNFILVTMISSLVIAFSNGMDLLECMIIGEGSYMAGLADFFRSYFIIFLLSTLFANYMEKSGAAESIASYVIGLIGDRSPYMVLVAVFMIGTLLTYGGISTFVVMFVLVPLVRKVFKEMNLPMHLFATPYFMGIGILTPSGIPGAPQIHNIIVSQALGTKLTASPLVALVSSFALVIWTLYRIRLELAESVEKGEGYVELREDLNEIERNNLPSFSKSILALVILVGVILVGGWVKLNNVIYTGLILAVLYTVIIFSKEVKNHHNTIINKSINSSIQAAMLPAAAIGFGQVLQASDGFKAVLAYIHSLGMSPMVSLSLLTFLVSMLIGSPSGALGIVTKIFLPMYDLTGVNVEGLHRILLISSMTYPPHNNGIIIFNQETGLDHKSIYKNVAISCFGGVLIQYLVAYLMIKLVY